MNHLYYGDNLAVLRDSIRDGSVDLIYLDPPFNSNASYNVLFKGPAGADSAAQIEAFDDTWHWNDSAEAKQLLVHLGDRSMLLSSTGGGLWPEEGPNGA